MTRDGADKGGRESQEWDNVNTVRIPAPLWQWSFTHLTPHFPLPLFHHLINLRCSTADQRLLCAEIYFFVRSQRVTFPLFECWETQQKLYYCYSMFFFYLYMILYLFILKKTCLDLNLMHLKLFLFLLTSHQNLNCTFWCPFTWAAMFTWANKDQAWFKPPTKDTCAAVYRRLESTCVVLTQLSVSSLPIT